MCGFALLQYENMKLDETGRFFHFSKSGGYIEIVNKLGNPEKVDRRVAWNNTLRMGKGITDTMAVGCMYLALQNKREDSK